MRVLQALATRSPILAKLYEEISESIGARPPFSLGYPSEATQSSYYLGGDINESDIALVSKTLEQNFIFPENTRVRKAADGSGLEVLLASVESRSDYQTFPSCGNESIRVLKGDHSQDLQGICDELAIASNYAANDLQRSFLNEYIESFRTGSLDAYRESQRIWVKDKAPRIENIIGFVEPYRDPHGIRAEFEGLVGIADNEETRLLSKLVQSSAAFIKRLPWTTPENDGKGPFEKSLFEPPDFSSIHSKSRLSEHLYTYSRAAALAYCSSIIFPGINLPNVSLYFESFFL